MESGREARGGCEPGNRGPEFLGVGVAVEDGVEVADLQDGPAVRASGLLHGAAVLAEGTLPGRCGLCELRTIILQSGLGTEIVGVEGECAWR